VGRMIGALGSGHSAEAQALPARAGCPLSEHQPVVNTSHSNRQHTELGGKLPAHDAGRDARRLQVRLGAPAAVQAARGLRHPMDGMALPDDRQRAAIAARMHEFEQALDQIAEGREAEDRCLEAARSLMASLQALINRMRHS
jgi:hypothetical protein